MANCQSMPVRERIVAQIRRRPSTQLGIGVVSRNSVDATIELANRYGIDLMLIASRRQVDMDNLGAGYVCGWNAARLAEYVRARDTGGRVLLCRDHGGPWQNAREMAERYDAARAMASARDSYAEDIEAGFSVLHIDPSIAPDGSPPLENVLERICALYDFCCTEARRVGRNIAFEVGAEEQEAVSQPLDKLEATLERVHGFCGENQLSPPLFVVVQTGTKVMEARNVGSLDCPGRIENEMPIEVYVPQVIGLLSHFGTFLKQHNTDYLPDEVVRWHPWFGIHAANVAPEFGVVETRAFLHVLEASRLYELRDAFLELAYASRKWEKWMLPATKANDRDRAVIAGHYVFSDPRFLDIHARAQSALGSGVDLDGYLRGRVSQAIVRYLRGFRLAE